MEEGKGGSGGKERSDDLDCCQRSKRKIEGIVRKRGMRVCERERVKREGVEVHF